MTLFSFRQTCSRRDYRELWAAVAIVLVVLISAFAAGWVVLPDDRRTLLSAEYLPGLLQIAVPLGALAWAVLASSVRRSRDASLPVSALFLCLAFYLVSAAALGLCPGRGIVFYGLCGLTVLASGLLGMIVSGLFLLDDFGFRTRDAGNPRRVDEFADLDALFGRRPPPELTLQGLPSGTRPEG